MGHGPVVVPSDTSKPKKRNEDSVEAWPSLNGIPLGPGPVVIRTSSSSGSTPTSTPTPTGTSVSEDQPHIQARDASKTTASWPSLSGVPLGHGPAVPPGHKQGDKPNDGNGDNDSQA